MHRQPGVNRMKLLIFALATLGGSACVTAGPLDSGLPVWIEDPDDGPAYYACEGDPGEVRVELIEDDERHEPLSGGVVFEIAQRPQGDITIFAPLWFGGIQGGTLVHEFAISFIDSTGEEIGRRSNGTIRLPCEEDGSVAGHYFEVFFGNPSIPAETWNGVEGRVTVGFETAEGLTVADSVEAVLVAVTD